MREALALLGRYLGISVPAQMPYRASFLMASLGPFPPQGNPSAWTVGAHGFSSRGPFDSR